MANVTGDERGPGNDIFDAQTVEKSTSEGDIRGDLEVEGEEAIADEAVGVKAELEDLAMEGETEGEGRRGWGFGEGLEEIGVMEIGV